MRALYSLAALVFLLAAVCGSATADEGMWPLYALKSLDFDALHTRGLELGPEEIYDGKGGGIAMAVVKVGGGSGSFVSPTGLIITNHHVAFGAIQKQSSVDQNYLKNGFHASTLADEIPAIGYNAYITQSFKDVTREINSVVKDDMTGLERYNAIDKKRKELVKNAEKKGDVKCSVASAYGGLEYYLITTFRIRDIRIVYIPPQSIGEYGGDIDNWMWPRHTGDFSFLRAYVAPDGSPAEYNENNVPYQSDTFLPISTSPLREGDFSMIIGYPGRTARYRSSYSIEESINHSYPYYDKTMGELIAIMEGVAEDDPDAAIKLSSRMKGLNNYWKNTKGMLMGLKRAGLLEKKREQEKELTSFLDSNPELAGKYGTVLPEIEKLYADEAVYRDRDHALHGFSMASRYYRIAATLYKWSIQKTKKDMDRERRYMQRNVEDLRQGLEEEQLTLVPEAEKRLLEYAFLRALRLPVGQQILAVDRQFTIEPGEDTSQAVSDYVNRIVDQTKIGDQAERMKMFDMSTEELLALDDPMINLAHELYDDEEESDQRDKTFSGALSKLRPLLIEAYAAWKKERFYPDANGTIRLSYGEVKGYSPADAVSYKYITTLRGVIEKETGKEPFANPEELLTVYESGDYGPYDDPALGDVPVNFLTTNDGTGGNSGSPILNGKGELIGLDFDTNWEGVVGDYVFDPQVKRSICVDVRYVLFILDRVYDVQNVLDELTIH